MKLDRNINDKGYGKYALIKARALSALKGQAFVDAADAIKVLEFLGIIDWGSQGTESEFFVIRLRDRYAGAALYKYSDFAAADDPEYAAEVAELAHRAGINSPFCKKPD